MSDTEEKPQYTIWWKTAAAHSHTPGGKPFGFFKGGSTYCKQHLDRDELSGLLQDLYDKTHPPSWLTIEREVKGEVGWRQRPSNTED